MYPKVIDVSSWEKKKSHLFFYRGRINHLTSSDKITEASWRLIQSINKDEKEKTRELWGKWSWIHS
jgi:hypothetical protein